MIVIINDCKKFVKENLNRFGSLIFTKLNRLGSVTVKKLQNRQIKPVKKRKCLKLGKIEPIRLR